MVMRILEKATPHVIATVEWSHGMVEVRGPKVVRFDTRWNIGGFAELS